MEQNGPAKTIYSKLIFYRKSDILPKLSSVEKLVFYFKQEPASEQTDLDNDAKMLATVLRLMFPLKTLTKLKSLL